MNVAPRRTRAARYRRPPLLPLLLTVIAGVSGCAALGGGTAPPETFLLDASPALGDLEPGRLVRGGRKVLLVAAPRAEAAIDTTSIAYSRAPLALDYYRDSRWADTPARMLEPVLARTLERTGAFRAVVTQPSVVDAELMLTVQLLELQQEFTRQPSQVRLAVRATLIATASNRIVASERFEAVEPAPSEDAYGGVRAASAALARVLAQIAGMVVGV